MKIVLLLICIMFGVCRGQDGFDLGAEAGKLLSCSLAGPGIVIGRAAELADLADELVGSISDPTTTCDGASVGLLAHSLGADLSDADYQFTCTNLNNDDVLWDKVATIGFESFIDAMFYYSDCDAAKDLFLTLDPAAVTAGDEDRRRLNAPLSYEQLNAVLENLLKYNVSSPFTQDYFDNLSGVGITILDLFGGELGIETPYAAQNLTIENYTEFQIGALYQLPCGGEYMAALAGIDAGFAGAYPYIIQNISEAAAIGGEVGAIELVTALVTEYYVPPCTTVWAQSIVDILDAANATVDISVFLGAAAGVLNETDVENSLIAAVTPILTDCPTTSFAAETSTVAQALTDLTLDDDQTAYVTIGTEHATAAIAGSGLANTNNGQTAIGLVNYTTLLGVLGSTTDAGEQAAAVGSAASDACTAAAALVGSGDVSLCIADLTTVGGPANESAINIGIGLWTTTFTGLQAMIVCTAPLLTAQVEVELALNQTEATIEACVLADSGLVQVKLATMEDDITMCVMTKAEVLAGLNALNQTEAFIGQLTDGDLQTIGITIAVATGQPWAVIFQKLATATINFDDVTTSGFTEESLKFLAPSFSKLGTKCEEAGVPLTADLPPTYTPIQPTAAPTKALSASNKLYPTMVIALSVFVALFM